MTSKELNEIINKTRRIPNISLTPKQVEDLIKDLEKLEQYEKIFDTPLLEIRKQLEILDILKKVMDKETLKWLSFINKEDFNKIKEWLENEKNNR